MPLVEEWISWVLSSLGSIVLLAKTFVETKKLVEKQAMPDIKAEDKAEEIARKQELARSLVALTGIEAAYNAARGLIVALNFVLLVHYAYKFAALTRPRHKD